MAENLTQWWTEYRENLVDHNDETCFSCGTENNVSASKVQEPLEMDCFAAESTSASSEIPQYSEDSSFSLINNFELNYSLMNFNKSAASDNLADCKAHSPPIDITETSQNISLDYNDEQRETSDLIDITETSESQSICVDYSDEQRKTSVSIDNTETPESQSIPLDYDEQIYDEQESAEPRNGLSRKRKRNPDDWNKNISKKTTATGEAFNKSGRSITKRVLGAGCINCRYKCSDKISLIQRQRIFREFWNIGNHDRQWVYLDKSVSIIHHENSATVSRTIARQYFLTHQSKKIKVCRTMFLDTFGISRKWLETIEKKKKLSNGTSIEADSRGKHTSRPIKIKPEITNSVKSHIELFEKIESHHCRASSSREYLSNDLNIEKMYRLYQEKMTEAGQLEIASKHYYRYIFCRDYNLSFHKPKKDQCDQCTVYSNLTFNEKLIAKKSQEQHLQNKDFARNCMKQDKNAATMDKSTCCASFDLQKVLHVPCAESSSFYYKRKLSIYNFTIFDLATKQGHCFIWNETVAKRGANEISSCLWAFITEKIKEGYKNFRFYNDNCGGQNRNSIVYSMYLKATMNTDISITHSYLVKGHTQMDGDCMHSTIEHAARNKILFTQEQWVNLINSAKVNPPHYKVYEFQQSQFLDFSKCVTKKLWKNIAISQLSSIKISDGKICYEKEYNGIITEVQCTSSEDEPLKPCYKSKIQLDENKKKDLKSLMKEKLIPTDFHDFYIKLME